MTGWGLDSNVKEAYRYLVENFDPGRDIGRDPCFTAGAIGRFQPTRIDEERGLFDPRHFQRRDQPLGPFVRGEERTGLARYVVESERDPLVLRNRARCARCHYGSEQQA